MSTRNLMVRTLLSLAVLAIPLSSYAGSGLRLEAAQGGDLIPSRLMASDVSAAVPPAGREPITFSWTLDASARLTSPLGPLSAASREHWVQATGAELERGVPLFTLAPGAVVRLSPATPGATMPQAGSLELTNTKGETHAGNAAFESLASAEQLAAAGMDLPAGSLAFRLRPELGSAGLILRTASGSVPATDRYLVHVLDAGSAVELRLTTARGVYLEGQRLVATLEAGTGVTRLPLGEVTGFVTSPAGRAWPLTFSAGANGKLRGELALSGSDAAAPGLWEIHTAAQGKANGQSFRRNARVAFAVSLPTARLVGTVERLAQTASATLEVKLGVEAASAGRYEVRGVLFGTDASGALRPAVVAHSAAWLEPGTSALSLSFDASALSGAGLKAPFEIRQLELRDQGHMSLLEHRTRGLVIE